MKNDNETMLIISKPSKKFEELLDKVKKHKLAQQEKLHESGQYTFRIQL